MDKDLKIKKYMDGILSWNEKINLTAITDPEEFYVKHIIDSLSITNLEEYKEANRVIDIGTGGGFPGAILAINNPEKDFVLLDSLKKRLNVIDELLKEVDVTNAKTLHSRVEDAGMNREYRETFDLAITRAVSSMPVLLEYALPLIKVNGYFIAYKGEEEEEFSNALNILGGRLVRIENAKMEKYGISHRFIIIQKIKETPKKYPRKAGTPLKNPLK